MAKYGSIEMMIRRDLLNDNEEGQYRWSVDAVMFRMNEVVCDIVLRYNAWAGLVQSTGAKITSYDNSRIRELCNAATPQTALTAAQISELRNIDMPLDERYADAVAYLAAAKLLETDDSDTQNATKAAQYHEIGKGVAQR